MDWIKLIKDTINLAIAYWVGGYIISYLLTFIDFPFGQVFLVILPGPQDAVFGFFKVVLVSLGYAVGQGSGFFDEITKRLP